MNANTNIDLSVVHDAIVADIKAAFPNLQTVEFYREDRKSLVTPACLLELTELEADPDNDPGTEQLAVLAKFEAELVIGFRPQAGSMAKAKLSIRMLAAALEAWLRMRRWTNPADPAKKLPTGEAMVIGAYQDDFSVMGRRQDQDLSQFEVWRVEWQQRLHLGETVWTDEGVTPGRVFVREDVSSDLDGTAVYFDFEGWAGDVACIGGQLGFGDCQPGDDATEITP